MQIQLFGVGVKGKSPVITAQSRVNCYLEPQQEKDKTGMAIIGSPGLTLFATPSASPSRGIWPVNSLTTPLAFTVHAGTLYSINNSGVVATIGTIGTTSGDVSMTDDGTNLMLADGSAGYYYNMVSPGGLTQIMDGNFAAPKMVTWNDTYFISAANNSNQWQLSAQAIVSSWPAVNIGFTGAAPGNIQGIIADHSVIDIACTESTEFWQDAGAPQFPYAVIPGSSQEYGLAAPFSLCKYDNSLAGLFKNRMGEVNVSRLSGFTLRQLSSLDFDDIINDKSIYSTTGDAEFFGYMRGGHPMLFMSFPTAGKTWEYDGVSKAFSERRSTDNARHWANKFANFQSRQLVTDYRNGSIYQVDANNYTDNGSMIPMEVVSKHIWNDDKYISIPQLEVDMEVGVGLSVGQGVNPQIMLEVSKDGGETFFPWSWESFGAIGQFRTRVRWTRLGRARDWVLKLRITDPVKRVITGCTAQVFGGTF